jgi:hypothetical protein
MYISHGPSEIMQLRACLPALLQLSLEPTQDVDKGQPALPRRADVRAAHPTHHPEALRRHRGSPPARVGAPTAALGEGERGCSAVRLRDVGVLFGEDAYDAGGDFVVDDRLVVFSDDVDSEFLYLVLGSAMRWGANWGNLQRC